MAIKAAPDNYVPPNANALAGRLIDDCYTSMRKGVDKTDESGELARKFGCTYTSDGWESCDSLPLINSAVITANNGGVYLRSVDTSGYTKNADYVASLIITDI